MHALHSIGVALWSTVVDMAPYLLLGFLIAGVLSVVVSPRLVERHLGGRGLMPSLKACLFGIPLPLCSCGVIPVAASLRRHGASRSATIAFLLSTPQTGVDSILVTYSLLGPVFAVARPLVALVTGLVGGALVHGFADDAPRTPVDDAASRAVALGAAPEGPRWLRALRYGFLELPQDIARSMLVGILIAALIAAFVPDTLVAATLGGGFLAMVLTALVGVPMYVCATASVPIAAALVAKGASPGAALVFLMTGPATNAAAITIIWRVMGKRTAILYLATVVAMALLFGSLLNVLMADGYSVSAPHVHDMMSGVFGTSCGIALLLILAFAVLRPFLGARAAPRAAAPSPTSATTLIIEGMTCHHCAGRVREALAECPGVTTATVDLDSGRATVSGTDLATPGLVAAVESLGYTVVQGDP